MKAKKSKLSTNGKKKLLGNMMKKSSSKINPFDRNSNSTATPKTHVLGRRVTGADRNVAAARANADKRRRETLLPEYRNRNKTNSFKDKRIGEALDADEMFLARLTETRKRQHQKNSAKFNLNEEEDNEILTHGGKKITDDDFNADDVFSEDDFEDEVARREFTATANFGGGEQEKKKSHAEIMQEVMMKAKLFKAEKQKEKARQEDVTTTLDEDFDEFQKLLEFRPTRRDAAHDVEPKKERDEYDQMTRELAFEAKAAATERRKTPEEIALEEKQKLDALEKKRLARMKGIEEEEDVVELKQKNDDSLDTMYAIDKEFNASADSDNNSASDSEEEEEEEDSDSDFSLDEEDTTNTVTAKKEEELPFVFSSCPTTPAALDQLFQLYAPKDCDYEIRKEICERLFKYYNPKLSSDNKKMIRALFACILRRFCLTNHSSNENDMLQSVILYFSKQASDIAGEVFRKKIAHLRNNCGGTLTKNDLLLCRVACNVFPTSDFRHNVISPLELLLNEKLGSSNFSSAEQRKEQIITGLMMASLSVHITASKDRFAPEVLVFLNSALDVLVKNETACFATTSSVSLVSLKSTNNKWADVALSVLALVNSTMKIYGKYVESFTEAFLPIYEKLQQINELEVSSDTLAGSIEECCSTFKIMSASNLSTRRPLMLRKIAPTVLKSFAPAFDENYTVRKDKGMMNGGSREKMQEKQLKRQVKRERKAAARELRLDATFLARERQNEQQVAYDEKKKKQKEIQSWLDNQAATYNQQVRKGGELLKGAGSHVAKRPKINK